MTWELAIRAAVGVVVSALAAYRGLKKRSLTRGGAFSAIIVGTVSMTCGYRFGILLLAFYFSSTKLTHYQEDRKATLDASVKAGGQRSAIQVLAVSLIATFLAGVYAFYVGEDRPLDSVSYPLATMLWGAYIAHYACCAADTWASELGVLSASSPILITRCRTVPPGTNGGISLLGSIAAAAGGTFIGLLFYLYHVFFFVLASSADSVVWPQQWPIVLFGLASGVIGCMLDSILGATLQSTYYCTRTNRVVLWPQVPTFDVIHISGYDILTNEQVNVVSVALTTILGALAAPYVF
ncbi:hypothetical protein H310_08513 [Aphanomyces invadans]|nr:hypothetical protein H310_08513 [Aphanomyces invadans]ETV99090.1 hypothetical protein H310_08513 [Aphanomyces invadans]|eukprot:XP_008872518.1 hypothetical protein H310_08513 [Aphanomyces invadans]